MTGDRPGGFWSTYRALRANGRRRGWSLRAALFPRLADPYWQAAMREIREQREAAG